MDDNKQKNTGVAAGCYLPYIGFLVSIYNLLTDKKMEPYCRFHSYHSLFLWILISFMIIGINILGFMIGCLPLIGPFLANIIYIIAQTVFYGGIVYGIFCAFNAYQGSSFSIPYITEFTNKYLEEKKMLP